MSSYDEQELKQNIVNILTEEQLRTMELEGTVPPNQDFFTEEDVEDMNLDCLRTKVLWTLDEDLLTTNFLAQDITIVDDGYDFLEIRYRYSTAHNIERSDTITAVAGTQGLLSFVNTPDWIFRRPFTLTTRTTLSFGGGFSGSGTTESTHNGVCIPIQIIGLYKSPAMIYTGKELHEGNGISINNGVVSAEHPVGSYHICVPNSENPAIKFGGTWTQIASNVNLPLGDTAFVDSMGTEHGILGYGVKIRLADSSKPTSIVTLGVDSSGMMYGVYGIPTGSNYLNPVFSSLYARLNTSSNNIRVDIWRRDA